MLGGPQDTHINILEARRASRRTCAFGVWPSPRRTVQSTSANPQHRLTCKRLERATSGSHEQDGSEADLSERRRCVRRKALCSTAPRTETSAPRTGTDLSGHWLNGNTSKSIFPIQAISTVYSTNHTSCCACSGWKKKPHKACRICHLRRLPESGVIAAPPAPR